MSIRAITFDLDDTLWHIGDAIREAERDAFDYLTKNCPKILHHHNIASLRDLMAEMVKQQPELVHQISRLRRRALISAVQKSGYDAKQAEKHGSAAFEIFLRGRHQVTIFEDAVPVLERLHNKYQIGALTNGNADINRLPIGRYFDFCFSAEQFQSSKPHPTLFLAALKQMELNASECVHVGDHPEHDIHGAQRAGFHTVWVNMSRQPWPGGTPASVEISCLEELPQAIAAINLSA